MPKASTINAVTPSAIPSEAEIAAWRALPRDEQVKRLRHVLESVDASTASADTMSKIWAEIEAEIGSDG